MDIQFAHPQPEDGAAMFRLVEAAGTLEANSSYTYLVFARHFRKACLMAWHGEEPVGFVMGYRIPEQADALFVWQVGVSKSAQGQGLGKRLLQALVEMPDNADVRYLCASVTPDNIPSRKLFSAFARENNAALEIDEAFMPAEHFPDGHESEGLFQIGPLNRDS